MSNEGDADFLRRRRRSERKSPLNRRSSLFFRGAKFKHLFGSARLRFSVRLGFNTLEERGGEGKGDVRRRSKNVSPPPPPPVLLS